MKAYLFGYNPDFPMTKRLDVWVHEMQDEYDAFGSIEPGVIGWSCANTHIQAGDEAFLFRHGVSLPGGLIGHGIITGPVTERGSYASGKPYRGAPIRWDAFKFYGKPLVGMEKLEGLDIFWGNMASGTLIKPEAHRALRAVWRKNGFKPAELVA
jgi:hypothetical protein